MNPESETLEATLSELAPAELSPMLFDRLHSAMVDAAAEQRQSSSADDALATAEEVLVGLRSLEPMALSPALFERLDTAMESWHETVPVEEKVVAMPFRRRFLGKPGGGMGWRSAAAVAALGVGLGILVSTPQALAPGGAGQATAGVNSQKPFHNVGEQQTIQSGMQSTEVAVAAVNSATVTPPSPLEGGSFTGDSIVGSPQLQSAKVSYASVGMSPNKKDEPILRAMERGFFWTAEGELMRCLELEIEGKRYFRNAQGEELVISQPQRRIVIEPVVVD